MYIEFLVCVHVCAFQHQKADGHGLMLYALSGTSPSLGRRPLFFTLSVFYIADCESVARFVC